MTQLRKRLPSDKDLRRVCLRHSQYPISCLVILNPYTAPSWLKRAPIDRFPEGGSCRLGVICSRYDSASLIYIPRNMATVIKPLKNLNEQWAYQKTYDEVCDFVTKRTVAGLGPIGQLPLIHPWAIPWDEPCRHTSLFGAVPQQLRSQLL